MKRIIIILAAGLALTTYARAEEEHPAVQAAGNANMAFVACVQAMTQAATTMPSEAARAMMIEGAPDKCARNVRAPNVQSEPSNASRGWAFAQFLVGAVAQYKGQALIWNGLASMMSRSADSTDNAVNQGFATANNGLDQMGNLTSQSIAKIPSHAPAAPAPEPVAPTEPTTPTE